MKRSKTATKTSENDALEDALEKAQNGSAAHDGVSNGDCEVGAKIS